MTPESRLRHLVQRWQQQLQGKEQPSIEELCQDCPELSEPLRKVLQAEQAPLPPTLEAPTAQATVAHHPSAAPAIDLPSSLPKKIGHFDILACLGEGGMGVVYKARQAGLNRLVALKVIRAGSQARSSDLARFRLEAEAIAQLSHPNLVQVHEVGEFQGQPFLAMELVDGVDLEQQLGSKPQPPRQAAALVETLARAMQAVHDKGIVHRDLKPANVLLTRDNIPKLSDFGLAKRLDSGSGPTLSGHCVGTPSYMAPEQARGTAADVTPAMDIYALGAILYEMLTGRPPFRADTAMHTLLLVMNQDPVAPRQLQPNIPIDLETICLKCLHKQPQKRYASAGELADDLRRFLNDEPIRARPIGRLERTIKWIRRNPLMTGLLAVCLLAAGLIGVGVAWYQMDLHARLEENRRNLARVYVTQGANCLDEGDWYASLLWFVEALKLEQGDPQRERMHRLRLGTVQRHSPGLKSIWFHDGPARLARFSADGKTILCVADDRLVHIRQADTGSQVGPGLEHPEAITDAVFSPNGQLVATGCRDGAVRLWHVVTGKQVGEPLWHGGVIHSVVFRGDGKLLLSAAGNGVVRIWGGENGKAITPPLLHKDAVHRAVFSPDGQHIATACADGAVRLWRADTGKAEGERLQHKGAVLDVAFQPGGGTLATATAAGTSRLWDVKTGKCLVGPLRHRAAIVGVDFTPAGDRLATAGDDHVARIWDRATGELLAQVHHRSGINMARFSPDGKRLITAADDNTARVWDAVTGDPLSPLLTHSGTVHTGVFSPDGQFLLTASSDHSVCLWTADTLAPATRERRVDRPGLFEVPRERSWPAPDGKWVLRAEGDHSARVFDVTTTEPVSPLLQHASTVVCAAFSGDGLALVTASDDNTARIWDTRTWELKARQLYHRGTVRQVAFSPNNSLVATASSDLSVRVWDADTGEPITPPLSFTGMVKEVRFASDLEVVFSNSEAQTWKWELKVEERSIEDLLPLVQVLAGSRIDGKRGMVLLEPGLLRQTWEKYQRGP